MGESPGGEAKVGTVALVGRPNAGKSTLLNRLLGEKLAIVSDKPQTTRQRLVGILSGERGQMVLYDTPGLHRPLYRLNRQMVQQARDALAGSDLVCLLVDASEPFGAGDAFTLDLVRGAPARKLLALNKVDRVHKPALLPRMARYAESGLFEEIVPISALTGDGCDLLLELLWERLPAGEPLYDPELLTTHPERFLVAERIREKVLEVTREELPFASAVLIDHWEEDGETGLVRIAASLLVERPGQKSILIGQRGTMIKRIGTAARLDLEAFLGRRVHLELTVRLEPRWRNDRRVLARLEREGA
jgi:GTPase